MMSCCLTLIILYSAAYLMEPHKAIWGVLKCDSPHDTFLDFTNCLHEAGEHDMGTSGWNNGVP